jgi:arginase
VGTIRIIGVPLDLGASRRGVDMGPSTLRIAQLADRLRGLGHEVEDVGNLRVPDRASLPPVESPLGFLSTITDVCRDLAEACALAVRQGSAPLVLGGDHSLGAGSVAGVATALAEAGKRIGLLWLDAHGDLNTPMSTLSGNVHGMPVAHLLGHGDPAMARIARPAPAVRPENVVLVGIRDLDPPEREHARRFGIRVFTMREIDERGLRAVMDDALALAGQGPTGCTSRSTWTGSTRTKPRASELRCGAGPRTARRTWRWKCSRTRGEWSPWTWWRSTRCSISTTGPLSWRWGSWAAPSGSEFSSPRPGRPHFETGGRGRRRAIRGRVSCPAGVRSSYMT